MPDMEINVLTLGGNLNLREHLRPQGVCWCNSDRIAAFLESQKMQSPKCVETGVKERAG